MPSTHNANPTGGAWAAILAAAIGCASFGIVTDLSEMSKPISKLLTFHVPTGDLSGKSTLGVLAWLSSWIVLHIAWKDRDIRRSGWITFISVLLIVLAMVLIFPEFVERIQAH